MKEQTLAVQRMQDYIQAHLEEEITLAELARVSCFSPTHAYRLFRAYLGMTPAEYIRKLRLTHSAQMLKKNKCRIIDAAFDLGFGSVDGYTRAFHREFGRNPSEYVKHPVPITLFIPYGVKFKELREDKINMENLQSVFVQVIHKPERKVVLKRGIRAEHYFDYCGEVACVVWVLLMSMDSLCGEPVCLWLPEKYKKPNTSTYVQGVEVALDFEDAIPDGFEAINLPESEYLMFQGEPFREENFSQAILRVQHAMDRYDPTLIGYKWDDDAPRIQLEPRGERGYIEMRAVKRS